MGLFGRSIARLDRFQQRHPAVGFPLAVRQKYADDQGGYLAASVTYYAFFSIFPLLLVLVTLLGYALEGDPDLQRRVLDSALADFPVIGPQLQTNVHSLQGSVPALAVGIGIALWAGTGVALALENALDHIWGVPIRRRANPLLARLRALLWIAVLGGVTLVATVLGSASAVAAYGPAVRILALIVSFGINLAVFLAVFRVLTSHGPSWRDVLPGALVAALAWEILQTVGGYIVDRQLRDASNTYGIFAIVIGMLSWLYLAANVTLLSAEINVVTSRKLWPRSFSLLGEQPLTAGDEDSLRQRAGVEERRADEDVQVEFDPPEARRFDGARQWQSPCMPRALWSGAISFGLVNAPVRMYTAISEHNVHFHLLHEKDGGRIHYKKVAGAKKHEVPDDEIVKGYEVSDDEYVTLTDDELAAARIESDKVIEIHDFVPLDEIDPIVFERTYYLGPAEGAERVYALLASALESSQLVGIATLRVPRSRPARMPAREGRRAAARAHVLRRRDPRRRRDPARQEARGRQAPAQDGGRPDRAHAGQLRPRQVRGSLPRPPDGDHQEEAQGRDHQGARGRGAEGADRPHGRPRGEPRGRSQAAPRARAQGASAQGQGEGQGHEQGQAEEVRASPAPPDGR